MPGGSAPSSSPTTATPWPPSAALGRRCRGPGRGVVPVKQKHATAFVDINATSQHATLLNQRHWVVVFHERNPAAHSTPGIPNAAPKPTRRHHTTMMSRRVQGTCNPSQMFKSHLAASCRHQNQSPAGHQDPSHHPHSPPPPHRHHRRPHLRCLQRACAGPPAPHGRHGACMVQHGRRVHARIEPVTCQRACCEEVQS